MNYLFYEQFVHRHNGDGSWDSICSKCFRTVANENHEEELFSDEQKHECSALTKTERYQILYMAPQEKTQE